MGLQTAVTFCYEKKKKNWKTEKKNLQQPVTFGEQLGCFASEKPEERI